MSTEDYSQLVIDYKAIFLETDVKDSERLYAIAQNFYDALSLQYEVCEEREDVLMQYRICELIDTDIMPKLRESVVHAEDKTANSIVALYRRFWAMSARRCLRNFALYIEQYKKKKVWDRTMQTMYPVFHYLDRFSTRKKFNLIRISLMPGIGKSYVANLFVAQSVGNNPNLQMLRITYSDDLVKITTRQTKSIIDSEAFREIFPRYQNVPEGKIFRSHDKYSFCLCDCEDEYNLFGFTRDGQLAHYYSDVVCELRLIAGNSYEK